MQTFAKCHKISADGDEFTSGAFGLDWFPSSESSGLKQRYETDILAALERLVKTWTGWCVINEIFYSTKTMKIMPFHPTGPKDFNAFSMAINNQAATLKDTTALTSVGELPARSPASFTASLSSGQLNVTAVANGPIQVDMMLSGKGIPNDVRISAESATNTKKGGAGQYFVDNSTLTVASQAMTGIPIGRVVGTGDGSDVIIRFSPSTWGASGAPSGPSTSPDEILLHEMVHGLRQMTGRSVREPIRSNVQMDNYEEFAAITVANIYRSEKGSTDFRSDHWGFTALTGPTTNISTFKSTYQDFLGHMEVEQPRFCQNLRNVRCAFNPFV